MEWWKCEKGIVDHPRVIAFRRLIAEKSGRKTIDFHAALGILTALLCGVCDHAETGDLSSFSAEAIAHWARWNGDPEALVGALMEAGVIDANRSLHGWKERHEHARLSRERQQRYRDNRATVTPTNALRGRNDDVTITPANTSGDALPRARAWTVPKKTDELRSRLAPTILDGVQPKPEPAEPEPPADPTPSKPPRRPAEPSRAKDLLDRWNTLAVELHLPRAEKLTADRARKADARIREGLLERWDDLSDAIRASPFHLGENDRGWRADFAWLITPGRALSLIERGGVASESVLAAEPVVSLHDAMLDRVRAALLKHIPLLAIVRFRDREWQVEHIGGTSMTGQWDWEPGETVEQRRVSDPGWQLRAEFMQLGLQLDQVEAAIAERIQVVRLAQSDAEYDAERRARYDAKMAAREAVRAARVGVAPT